MSESSDVAAPETGCVLCGLPVIGDVRSTDDHGLTLHFCCAGCRMVYHMLAEAADAPDPSRFKDTDLYRRCVAAGVIPADEADLAARRTAAAPEASTETSTTDTSLTLPLQARVAGMWCPACAWVIQDALERMAGVQQVACDFATDRLHCRYDPSRVAPQDIQDVLKKLGYATTSEEDDDQRGVLRNEFVRWAITAFLSVNVMMLSWALYSGFFTSLSPTDIRYLSWPIVGLATVVMIFGGGPLFRKAWWGLRHKAPGMETLVCLGAGSAYLYSLYHFMLKSWHLYFDTATMLITLVLLGKLLETRAKTNVRRDLEGFLALQPNKVRMVSDAFPQGRFVALGQLRPGDIFRVTAGEIAPADGRIVHGRGRVDASAVTGESRPVGVDAGDALTSGTTLIEGDVAVEAMRVGPDALVGQMIAVIENGLARQSTLESRTDRWLALFVPLMVGIAAATGVGVWLLGGSGDQAVVRALTVMVIACPCALGIAIPLARIAGISRAGRLGILVRDVEAFERAVQVDHIVFDKTGTLTLGRWALEAVKTYGAMGREQALGLAAGLEKGVDHTIARVMTDHARKQGVPAETVSAVEVRPEGVQGEHEGRRLRMGTRGFALPQDDTRRDEDLPEALQSRVYFSVDGALGAVFSFGDAFRQSSPDLVAKLSERGYPLYMVSGDAHGVTRVAADHLKIPQAQGGLLPQEKAAFVETLQADGGRVAMVGDGINDAPALACADLSVAVHRDAALSRQAADITLMRGDPIQLLDFFTLARRVNAKVSQNLTLAWIYNLVGVPIAMSGLLNPLISATAMLLSSLTVIGNTLLLVRK